MIKIATWNINSINARIDIVKNWIIDTSPDVLLLQETKCTDEAFPHNFIEDLGYNIALHGQKTYNGVAIISKFPIEDVKIGFDLNPDKSQARYIEAIISSENRIIRVASVYVPHGQEVGSERFSYKIDFLDGLFDHFRKIYQYEEICVIGGDYNIAPEDIDVYSADELRNSIDFSDIEKEKFRKFLNLGFSDAYRIKNPKTQAFSWWDYRNNAFLQNHGMRIDHLLISPEAADVIKESYIDLNPRKLPKPSDHTPVIIELL